MPEEHLVEIVKPETGERLRLYAVERPLISVGTLRDPGATRGGDVVLRTEDNRRVRAGEDSIVVGKNDSGWFVAEEYLEQA